MANPNLGQPVKNKYKVPKKQWGKWTNLARRVFNDMMHSLRPNMQFAFLHPSASAAPKEHWDTTRWNVAWTAASCINDKKPLGRVVQDDKVYTRRPKAEPVAKTRKRLRRGR